MISRQPRKLHVAACVAAVVTGTFVVLGCLLALKLEADGFGRPRDTDVRSSYVAALVAGAAAGVAVPGLLCLGLLKGSRRTVRVGLVLASALVTLSILAVLGTA